MLKQRIITASILIPIALWGFFYLEGWGFAVFISLIVILGAWEWAQLAGITHPYGRCIYALSCALLLGLLWMIPDADHGKLIVLLGIFWWGMAWQLVSSYPASVFRWKQKSVIRYLMGLLILIPAWEGLLILKNLPNGNWIILSVMIFVWAADIGAYFAGRQWGKTKLAPKVSPGKSWQGFAGGLAAVLFIALCIYMFTDFAKGKFFLVLICALILMVSSVLGDLTESMFKREVGVKDSSNLLPGHGGVFDRIDSLTAAIPVSVMLLWVLGYL